jgi:hypothetical protein
MAVLVPIFLVVFIAFGLSFDVLFSETDEKPEGSADASKTDGGAAAAGETTEGGSSSRTPENIFKWVMQTLVMSTGEMNYNDLKFTAWVARLVFVVFVFVGHLLLMNALIGFAVNDTTELHRLAAAHCARKRAAAVANVEKALCWTAAELTTKGNSNLLVFLNFLMTCVLFIYLFFEDVILSVCFSSTGRLLSNFLNFVCDWPPGSGTVDFMIVLY